MIIYICVYMIIYSFTLIMTSCIPAPVTSTHSSPFPRCILSTAVTEVCAENWMERQSFAMHVHVTTSLTFCPSLFTCAFWLSPVSLIPTLFLPLLFHFTTETGFSAAFHASTCSTCSLNKLLTNSHPSKANLNVIVAIMPVLEAHLCLFSCLNFVCCWLPQLVRLFSFFGFLTVAKFMYIFYVYRRPSVSTGAFVSYCCTKFKNY